MSKEWRTLRVVVEVPVRGEYGVRDLRWDVEQLLGHHGERLHRAASRATRIETGRIEVKEFERVVRNRMGEHRRSNKSLEERISRLEEQTDPHRNSPATSRCD